MREKKKRCIAILMVMAVMLSGIYVNPASEDKMIQAKEKPEEYIVMPTDGDIDLEEVTEDLREVEEVVNDGELAVCEMTKEEAEQLRMEKDVLVEKNSEIMTSAKDTKKQKKDKMKSDKAEWNMRAVHAAKASEKKTGKKVKIAVIDSGVDDYNDIELVESINFIPGEEELSPLYVDITGHGSSVAGIIAAKDNGEGITGIAPEAEIYSAKVFDDENRTTVSRVIDAIYWAIEKKVNIINMSFGIVKDSPALHHAVRVAEEKGILLIAAAGNGKQVEYPAAYREVMAVGAVNPEGGISEDSATGEQLEVVAPGEQICSTGAFGGVLVSDGTSMSAPHITGIAAKLWGKDLSCTADFIRQLINASANQFTSALECGNGLVDYSYAEKIYDEFKASYVPGKSLAQNQSGIEENEREVLSFEDVDHVEGRWKKEAHEAGIINSSLTKSEIVVLKKGTAFPDRCEDTLKLSDHPFWHGGYKNETNYISSYIYATRMAVALKKGNSTNSAANPIGLKDGYKKSMLKAVNNLNWSGLLPSVSKKNKCLFVWGMAIHDAMDVYAHSTCGRINGVWQHLDHPKKIAPKSKNGLADRTDSKAFPQRYATAVKVAKKSLNTYVSGKTGNVHDFVPKDAYKDAGITWVIFKLVEYTQVHDKNLAKKLTKYSINKVPGENREVEKN